MIMETLEALRQLQQLIEQWKREQYTLWSTEDIATLIVDDLNPHLDISMSYLAKLQIRKLLAYCDAFGLNMQIEVNSKDNIKVLIIISSI